MTIQNKAAAMSPEQLEQLIDNWHTANFGGMEIRGNTPVYNTAHKAKLDLKVQLGLIEPPAPEPVAEPVAESEEEQ